MESGVPIVEARGLYTEAAWLARFDGQESVAQLLGDFDTDERELISLVFTLKLIGALTGG